MKQCIFVGNVVISLQHSEGRELNEYVLHSHIKFCMFTYTKIQTLYIYVYVYLFIYSNAFVRLGFRNKDLTKVSESMRDTLKAHLTDVRRQTKTKTQR